MRKAQTRRAFAVQVRAFALVVPTQEVRRSARRYDRAIRFRCGLCARFVSGVKHEDFGGPPRLSKSHEQPPVSHRLKAEGDLEPVPLGAVKAGKHLARGSPRETAQSRQQPGPWVALLAQEVGSVRPLVRHMRPMAHCPMKIPENQRWSPRSCSTNGNAG